KSVARYAPAEVPRARPEPEPLLEEPPEYDDAPWPDATDEEPPQEVVRRPVIRGVVEIAAAVDALPPLSWLASPVWPEDAYGVIAAVDKAGKSWVTADLSVSVAAGCDWLGVFPCPAPGPVVMFIGEGAERRMIRRLRAVCEAKGVKLED